MVIFHGFSGMFTRPGIWSLALLPLFRFRRSDFYVAPQWMPCWKLLTSPMTRCFGPKNAITKY